MPADICRVLVVDDEAWWRDRLGNALRNFGLEFDTAADGVAALSRLERSEYGLIVLDVMMPRMDGIDLLKHLEASTASTPVVLLRPRPADDSFTYLGGDPVKLTVRKDRLEDLVPLMKEIRGLLGLDKTAESM